MMVSDAKLAANRRNAARSTGPKTEDGKAASRRNALKHGLTGRTLDLDDATVVVERAATLDAEVKPRWSWQTWIVGEVAGITRRLDRLGQEEAKLRDLGVYQAITSWDDFRRLAAANLGARLAADPVRGLLQLRATPQGCDWLIERWVLLAHLADSAAGWTSAQRSLALDMLGTPPEARPEAVGLRLDQDGRATGLIRSDGEVARAALAELRDHRAGVIEADAVAQALAEQGVGGATALDLRRLRRYETALHRRLVWCVEQLDRSDATPPAELPPRPRPVPSPVEPPPALDRPGPEFLAIVPTGGPGSLPLPPERSRADAKLQQAETRRDRKRRKLQRRRG